MGINNTKLPRLALLYFDYVLRFFDKSNFKSWPDKIYTVTYHWKDDKNRFIQYIKNNNIDILIGNIPATAYETFRQIQTSIPKLRFIPSLDSQFSNKSKENFTRFAWRYDLNIPKTYIFYNKKEGKKFLKNCEYPKIIKKSYGASNYGGYFVHKVKNYNEAKKLLESKKYNPLYIQDFVNIKADMRIMLIGHKPVCAFWRVAPKGKWITNTSQGGKISYKNIPKNALDLAVKSSKSANAEYWSCDIAINKNKKAIIFECSTAFAAYPYIRDWIAQYIMSIISKNHKKPHIPMYNWEELGKINSSLLRTMRYITFGKYSQSYDDSFFNNKIKNSNKDIIYTHKLDNLYKMKNARAS